MPLCAAVGASAWALAETKPPQPHFVAPVAAVSVTEAEPLVALPPPAAPTVHARAAKPRPVRIPLPRVARVSGQSVDSDGHGVAATLSFEATPHLMIVIESDDHGGFVVEACRPLATYHLHASDGNGEDDQQLAVSADEEQSGLLVALRPLPEKDVVVETENEEGRGSVHCKCTGGACSCDSITLD